MAADLGVAVIGLGVGEQHARAFAKHPACRIQALYDLDVRRSQTLAEAFDGCDVAESFDDVLYRKDVQIVSIASYDDAHYEQVVKALEAGKHVFVEKPVCTNLEELREIKSLWLRAGGRLKLRSNLVLRGAPLYKWTRTRIAEGRMGRLYSFDAEYLYGRLQKITDGWRGSIENYSVMEGGGIHMVDLLLWLTGEKPTVVSAAGNDVCTEGMGLEFNDFVAATLQFSSPLIARVVANFGCIHRHQHVVRLYGTEATLLYDDCGPRLHESRDPAANPKRLPHDPLPVDKGVLIPDFVAAVLADKDDRAETQSFFDDISVCIAADAAVCSGEKERVVYV